MSKTKKVYRAKTHIRENYQVEINARDHIVIADEPTPYGDNTGMTPVELLLGALGACKSMVFKSSAKRFNVEIDQFEILLEGDFDSAGYLGDPNIPIGFSNIRTIYNIQSVSAKSDVEKLIHHVETHCPVAATIDVAPQKEVVINYNSEFFS